MTRKKSIGFSVTLFLISTISAQSMYMGPDLVHVPVSRLTRNLEQKVQKEPKNAQHWYELARVYSMAYAQKSEALSAVRGKDGDFFVYYGAGLGSQLPPRASSPGGPEPETKDPERLKQAKASLLKAIEAYEKAIQLGMDNPYVRLGLGWSREENGEKEKAKEQYRKAVDLAWNQEKSKSSIFDMSMTTEAASYLKKLLDPEKDSKELAEINRKVQAIERVGRSVTPILVPLRSGLPLESLVAPQARVMFDLDGSGLAREWGWITPDAAWLVFPGPDEQMIDSGTQMFGGFTFLIHWPNGYDALASLDDDGDGVLRGDELHGIALWRDSNSNGVCEPGEVQPLSAYGITSLSCRHEPHPSGIQFNPAGCEIEDGTTRATYDWIAPSAQILLH